MTNVGGDLLSTSARSPRELVLVLGPPGPHGDWRDGRSAALEELLPYQRSDLWVLDQDHCPSFEVKGQHGTSAIHHNGVASDRRLQNIEIVRKIWLLCHRAQLSTGVRPEKTWGRRQLASSLRSAATVRQSLLLPPRTRSSRIRSFCRSIRSPVVATSTRTRFTISVVVSVLR